MRGSRWRCPFLVLAVLAMFAAACGSDGESGSTTSDGPTPTTTTTTTTEATTTSEAATTEPTEAPTTSGAPTTAVETVTVYFSTGDGTDCRQVSPFIRTVPVGDQGELEAAITALLAGPTADEVAAGAHSFFSGATADSLALIDDTRPGVVVIGFEDLRPLIPNASTSCGSAALLAQLNRTTLQYVDRVRYEMLGSCQIFAEWLQGECADFTSEGAVPAVLTIAERASGSGCTPMAGLPNGIWFGYVESTTASTIAFDLACWFDGDAAIDAAAEDGAESPPPNDYYVRNNNELLRTVPVAAGTSVSWVPDAGDPSSTTVVGFDEWSTLRMDRSSPLGVWLTVAGEQVVEIVEQWVP